MISIEGFLQKIDLKTTTSILSRIMTVVFMFLSVIVTTFSNDKISGVWSFVIECGARTWTCINIRWFWWRVNAISEIVATITPVYSLWSFIFGKFDVKFPNTLIYYCSDHYNRMDHYSLYYKANGRK